MKKLTMLLLVGATCLTLLAGCGKKEEPVVETVPVADVTETVVEPETVEVESEVEVEPETETVEEDLPPEEGMVRSQLTNEWISGDLENQRPVAVMIPNETACLPHYNISNADILYECNVEANMTRLMAVFKDWRDLEKIGNIRSCRDYYVYWAKEYDAVYVHVGGPFYILPIINDATTNNISGSVLASDNSQKKGYVDSAFYRTSDRKAPHNCYTDGSKIASAMKTLGYADEYTSNYEGGSHFTFATGENTLEQYGENAFDVKKIDLSGSYKITKTYFEYNEADGLYYRYQGMQSGDKAHVDAATGEHLAFKNVLVQFTHYETRDDKGYLGYQCHDTTKDGYYFTNGKAIHVTWEKTSDYGSTVYYDDNGNEIEVNTGKTMICILKDGSTLEVE